jgi:hypothetical protein
MGNQDYHELYNMPILPEENRGVTMQVRNVLSSGHYHFKGWGLGLTTLCFHLPGSPKDTAIRTGARQTAGQGSLSDKEFAYWLGVKRA